MGGIILGVWALLFLLGRTRPVQVASAPPPADAGAGVQVLSPYEQALARAAETLRSLSSGDAGGGSGVSLGGVSAPGTDAATAVANANAQVTLNDIAQGLSFTLASALSVFGLGAAPAAGIGMAGKAATAMAGVSNAASTRSGTEAAFSFTGAIASFFSGIFGGLGRAASALGMKAFQTEPGVDTSPVAFEGLGLTQAQIDQAIEGVNAIAEGRGFYTEDASVATAVGRVSPLAPISIGYGQSPRGYTGNQDPVTGNWNDFAADTTTGQPVGKDFDVAAFGAQRSGERADPVAPPSFQGRTGIGVDDDAAGAAAAAAAAAAQADADAASESEGGGGGSGPGPGSGSSGTGDGPGGAAGDR